MIGGPAVFRFEYTDFLHYAWVACMVNEFEGKVVYLFLDYQASALTLMPVLLPQVHVYRLPAFRLGQLHDQPIPSKRGSDIPGAQG